jgi:2-octaprenyl-6-methoxyphenol hydroxylase
MSQISVPKKTDFDVLIVGAGMVGMTLAASLKDTSLKVGLVEAKDAGTKAIQDDGRASAIALGSVQILDQAGAWRAMQELGVSPIHQVKISDQGFPQDITLHREDLEVEALGYVVENWVTEKALRQVLFQGSGVDWFCPAVVEAIAPHPDYVEVMLNQTGESHQLTTRLLVGADGKQSAIRQWAGIPITGWAYDQVLIVCTITTEFSHHQTGYERFHTTGPFAILPMTPSPDSPDCHRCCVVWTARVEEKDLLMGLDDEAFIQAMTPRLSPELGRVLSVSPRFCYAPRRQNANRYFGDRLVLIGDAAHATHPVGGQGFNMGARDAAHLAEMLRRAHIQGHDLGDSALLARYDQQRRLDNETVLLGTDLANRLFSNDWLPLQALRRLALLGVDQIAPVKQLFLRYAMGLAEQQPH